MGGALRAGPGAQPGPRPPLPPTCWVTLITRPHRHGVRPERDPAVPVADPLPQDTLFCVDPPPIFSVKQKATRPWPQPC